MLLQENEGRQKRDSDLSDRLAVGRGDADSIEIRTPHAVTGETFDEGVARERVALLRHFHLGDPSATLDDARPDDSHLPALLARFRGLRRFRYEYPLVLFPPASAQAGEGEYTRPLEQFLKDAVESFAATEGSARILKDNLSWLEFYLRERMTGEELPVAADSLMRDAADALVDHLDLDGSNLETLKDDLARLLDCVVPASAMLALSPNTPFHLMYHVMACRRQAVRERFQARLEENLRGLTRLLAIEKEKSPDASRSIGKIGGGAWLDTESFSGVVRHRQQGSRAMPEQRHRRIANAVETLRGFAESGVERNDRLHIVMRPGALVLKERDSFSITESRAPCHDALAYFDDLAEDWSKVFAAMRIAELEIDDGYESAVHDSWFANFDWEAFSDEELQVMPTVVAVETTTQAAGEQMHWLSRALNSGKPVQVAMTVSAHGSPEKHDEDPLRGLRMEFAYFGIGHREAVVNQVSTSRLGSLVAGFEAALASTRPSLHLIHTGFTGSQPLHPWIMAGAALEARAHPYIRFNPAFLDGGQIDFAENPAPERDWSADEFSWADADGEMVAQDVDFTFADYCLLKPELRHHFRRIAAGLEADELVTVAEYLALPVEEQDRSVPYVLSVDGDGVVHRLAVSRLLMFACRDRLGFWRDLQSMAGIHNYYVEQAIARVREEEQARAAAEIEALEAAHAEEIEQVRESAAEEVMGRLTEVLMELDLSGDALARAPAAAPSAAPAEAPTREEAAPEAEPAAPEPEEEEEEEALSFDEPWIDSMMCTSCDDCMSINKVMFVYNDDKQAYITDAKAGTYEQLVRAAELCPARCIHPGKPLNSSEPGLDELIKRAEPFN